jgi:hypothetical protein
VTGPLLSSPPQVDVCVQFSCAASDPPSSTAVIPHLRLLEKRQVLLFVVHWAESFVCSRCVMFNKH